MIKLSWEDYPEKYDDVSILQNIKFAPAIDFEHLTSNFFIESDNYPALQKLAGPLNQKVDLI